MIDDRAKRIALLLQAIESLHADKAEFLTEWKSRMTLLENQLGTMKTEILTGQGVLPMEPIPIEKVMEKTAELVNSGALDTDRVKVTAKVQRAKP